MKDNITNISSLVEFNNHPFTYRDGIENEELIQNIKDNCVIEPIIVRPINDDKYEIISGHRRVKALKELGVYTVPAIIKDLKKKIKELEKAINNLFTSLEQGTASDLILKRISER